MIERINEQVPKKHPSCYVHKTACLLGSVMLEENVSIWPCAVLRADIADIIVGAGSNIQDNATVHTDRGRPTVIGDYVTVGHNAVVHGCTVGDYSLIGMGAVVLNGAKIGKHCLIGAGSLVLEGQEIPDGSLAVGSPAKVKRMLTEQEKQKIYENSMVYVETGKRLKKDGYARNE